MRIIICTGSSIADRIRGKLVKMSLASYIEKKDIVCRSLEQMEMITYDNDNKLYSEIIYGKNEYLVIFDEDAYNEFDSMINFDNENEEETPMEILFKVKTKLFLVYSTFNDSQEISNAYKIIARKILLRNLVDFLTIEVGYKCKRVFDQRLVKDKEYYLTKHKH